VVIQETSHALLIKEKYHENYNVSLY
jgi:hypothetical protein